MSEIDYRVVVLSARADNLVRCLSSVFENEPKLPRNKIIVVDDGAKSGAEGSLQGVTWIEGVKPFCYARNANLGIRAAGTSDIVLLNDDTVLATRGGLGKLAGMAQEVADLGVLSAAVKGFVGNTNQKVLGIPGFRSEGQSLAFIGVYIPRTTFEKIGLLDESFIGYGFEDDDFCLRARRAGLRLGVYEGCVVEHLQEKSTFRTRPDLGELFDRNRRRFEEKWRNRVSI
jgi:GT2 family glycosyltransferase